MKILSQREAEDRYIRAPKNVLAILQLSHKCSYLPLLGQGCVLQKERSRCSSSVMNQHRNLRTQTEPWRQMPFYLVDFSFWSHLQPPPAQPPLFLVSPVLALTPAPLEPPGPVPAYIPTLTHVPAHLCPQPIKALKAKQRTKIGTIIFVR